jgi:cobalt-zinc-cadmium efflux system membrane fusion protein
MALPFALEWVLGGGSVRRSSSFATAVVAAACLSCRGGEVPKEAKPAPEEGGAKTVVLTPDAQKAAAIETVVVDRAAFGGRLTAPGVIRPDAQQSVVVRARTEGRALRVTADVGARVAAGDTLAVLEASDATAALTRYRTASAREIAARKALERADHLLEIQAISRADRDARRADAEAASAEAEAARQDLSRLGLEPASSETGRPAEIAVRAPLAGTVLERSISPGLLVDKGAALFVVASLSPVWAVVDVYEKDLGDLSEHGEVEVKSDTQPGERFHGRLALIEPAVDAASRVAHVRVTLDNPAGKLRPGQFVTVDLPLKTSSDAPGLSIPSDAVQRFSGVTAAFVEGEAGHYELRPIELGREAQGTVEVKQGLEAGEKVVIKGAFLLKSELLKGSFGGE